MSKDIEKAYEEVKLCVVNNKHNLSTETLNLCLEALRILKETEHNGYSNYPTWLVASFIDNNEKLYKELQNLINEMWSAGEDDFTVIGVLAQTIEMHFGTECMGYQIKCDNTVWSSMLNHCERDLINYREIAMTMLKD